MSLSDLPLTMLARAENRRAEHGGLRVVMHVIEEKWPELRFETGKTDTRDCALDRDATKKENWSLGDQIDYRVTTSRPRDWSPNGVYFWAGRGSRPSRGNGAKNARK